MQVPNDTGRHFSVRAVVVGAPILLIAAAVALPNQRVDGRSRVGHSLRSSAPVRSSRAPRISRDAFREANRRGGGMPEPAVEPGSPERATQYYKAIAAELGFPNPDK